MIGLTKEQLLACAGPPANQAAVGQTEVWSYNSGNGQSDVVVTGNQFIATANASQRFCTVNVAMTNGRVSSVNYTGPTGGGKIVDLMSASPPQADILLQNNIGR